MDAFVALATSMGSTMSTTQLRDRSLAQANRRNKREQDPEALTAQLYQQIGPLKVDLDWLKKNLACSVEANRQ
jgi:hypothetical protein